MANEQMRPASNQQAPDPANTYERANPKNEAGMGRLDNDKAVPHNRPDQSPRAVTNAQDPSRQLNGEDVIDQRGVGADKQPNHSMLDEEPLGADTAPQDISDPEMKRHPRTGGKGGTPDEREDRSAG